MIPWPSATNYRDALQHPQRAFRDPFLQQCRAEVNKLGVPRCMAGLYANVYRLQCGDVSKAVRVFLRANAERTERYQVIQEHLAEHLPRCIVPFVYDPEGIRINADWFPVQILEWVPGPSLGLWVRERLRLGESARIVQAAERWVELIRDLKAQKVAHGDLEHNNVLVRDDALVLVDYDNLTVPALVGRPSLETGRPAYQHPQRVDRPLSLALDDFPAWNILIALRALAADPGLLERCVEQAKNENLLFMESDFRLPNASSLWPELSASPDADVRRWATRLRQAVEGRFDQIPSFAVDNTLIAVSAPPTPALGPRVFISHATPDRHFVEHELIPLLNRHGIETWYARDDIQTTERWERAILQGLKGCDWFLVVMSARSARSIWVKHEVDWAFSKRLKRIIPVLLDDCDIDDFHIGMAGIQHVDYRREADEARRKLLAVWDLMSAKPRSPGT